MSHVAAVAPVHFLRKFIPCEYAFFDVNYYYIVARVDMRRKLRLVFSTKNRRNLARYSAENLAFGVDDITILRWTEPGFAIYDFIRLTPPIVQTKITEYRTGLVNDKRASYILYICAVRVKEFYAHAYYL